MNNKEYECKNCFNKATFICESCVETKYPSGKTSKPSRYKSVEEVMRNNTKIINDFIRNEIFEALSGDISTEKPPAGLKPKFVHDAQRAEEIKDAVNRYFRSNKPIPPEWIEEYNAIAKGEKKV